MACLHAAQQDRASDWAEFDLALKSASFRPDAFSPGLQPSCLTRHHFRLTRGTHRSYDAVTDMLRLVPASLLTPSHSASCCPPHLDFVLLAALLLHNNCAATNKRRRQLAVMRPTRSKKQVWHERQPKYLNTLPPQFSPRLHSSCGLLSSRQTEHQDSSALMSIGLSLPNAPTVMLLRRPLKRGIPPEHSVKPATRDRRDRADKPVFPLVMAICGGTRYFARP